MLENRRRMHNHCENRRRTAIHQGLCQLRRLLDEGEGRSRVRAPAAALPDEEASRRIHLSRPETLVRAVARIEQLRTSVGRLEQQHQQLVLETQHLRRLSMGGGVGRAPCNVQGVGSVPEVNRVWRGKHPSVSNLSLVHGTWTHAGGTPLPQPAITGRSLPPITSSSLQPPPRPRSPSPAGLHTGHNLRSPVKGADGTARSDHQFTQ